MNPSWDFHHIGVACDDLEREERTFLGLGYRREGEIFADPIQGIRGLFLTGAGPRMELVTPFDDQAGVLTGVLAQRLKMYHIAYLVPDLMQALKSLKEQRAKLVVNPSPAVAFNGRSVAFLVLPNRMLIEIIEKS